MLGIDDWAKKKGRTYGTILVDLETHRPVDLLDSRETEEVTEWLRQHPSIEVISRDRGLNYIKAATLGAPEAEQVADRWHLLKNLREAAETMFTLKPMALAAASTPEVGSENEGEEVKVGEEVMPPILSTSTNEESIPSEKLPSKLEQKRAASYARRQERFEQVKQLHQEGYPIREISRELNLARQTVRKYLEADVCPRGATRASGANKLTSWLPYLEERWQAGYTNATQLWREIEALGFSGSRGLVSRWAAQERKLLPMKSRYSRQQSDEVIPKLNKQIKPVPWLASAASWILVKDRTQLDEQEQAGLARMTAVDSQVALVADLTLRFVTLVKQKKADKLDQWLMDAVASGVRSFISFANGIRQDFAAVYNALSMVWSNGPTEGNVNRLKFLKRQMYGRAKFDLLRKKVLYRPTEG